MNNKNNKENLLKLIEENPNLPVIFFAANDDFCPDYGSTVFENFYCYKATIYIDDDEDRTYYDDYESIKEIYSDKLCDEEGFKDLFNEEYEKAIDEYISEHIEHYEAIVISMSH